jgi:hypothetical protein
MRSSLPQGLVVVSVLALCQAAFEQPSQISANKATLIELYGSVQSRHAAGGYKTASVGEVLVPGDGIKTGSSARAQLALGSNQYVRMDQNTQVLITQVQQDGLTSFKTLVGGVWVTIQKALGAPTKFEVHTPSVVAAARGTIFRCQVDEAGGTDVFVYDGEVDVTGADQVVRVTPDQFARMRQGMKLALAAINADDDERQDFVRYNRHCEVLQGVGNPVVLVALSVIQQTKPQAALPTSAALVEDLRRLGLKAQAVTPEQLKGASFERDGQVRLKPKAADYVLVGAIQVQAPPRPGLRGRGVATVHARLLAGDDYHVVAQAQAKTEFFYKPAGPRGLPNGQDKPSILAALKQLGHEVSRQMAPQLLREMVADRPAAVRVDLVGLTDPRQRRALKVLLAPVQQDGRVIPLPRFAGGVSYLLTGGASPEEVARFCLERGGQWVQSAQTQGRVVTVTFRPGAPPPGD